MQTASSLIGVREVARPANSATILSWANRVSAKVLGIAYKADATPWCGLFAATVMVANGIKPPRVRCARNPGRMEHCCAVPVLRLCLGVRSRGWGTRWLLGQRGRHPLKRDRQQPVGLRLRYPHRQDPAHLRSVAIWRHQSAVEDPSQRRPEGEHQGGVSSGSR